MRNLQRRLEVLEGKHDRQGFLCLFVEPGMSSGAALADWEERNGPLRGRVPIYFDSEDVAI